MEMESSRGGGGGRSRQPQAGGVKRPRLMSDDDQRGGAPAAKGRAFPTRPSTTADPRLRKTTATAISGHKERDSSTTASTDTSRERDRGLSSYQLRQMQELVSQYKIALAELTFNSKPIITNMTIIAGENLEAAKGITASICANILQVPSDQKLPSLYLLDSIVKNIGRDYIKYFAARLPEVFCKAYKQVDAPIHSGMRHLFGTWKGVFPPAALQFIEKELGFSSVANGSSAGGTTARTDSQTARPPHSIHVNPKYLDAKQLLQNANRSKAVSSDIDDMDTERIDRASVAGSARQWTDPQSKNIHRPIRGLVNDTSTEKSSSLSYGDNKLVSDRSRFSDLKMGRSSKPVTEKATHDNSWYEVGSRNPDLSINQRNKSDALMHGNFKAPRSLQDTDQQFPVNHSAIHKRNKVTTGIWKNSEEEEYMWDDMNSKLTGHGLNNDSIKGSSWASDDVEKGRGLRREKCIGTQWNRNEHYGQLETISGGEDRSPYFREFEENLPQSHTQHEARLRNHSNEFSDPLSIKGSFSGHQSSSARPYQEPQLCTTFGHTRIGSRFSSQLEGNQVHPSSGLSTSLSSSFGKVESSSFSHLTPPHGSEMRDFQESQSYSRVNKKLAEILGRSDQIIPSKITPEPLPSIPSKPIHQQSHSLPILQKALSQSPHDDNTISASSSPYTEPWNLTPFLQPAHVEVQPQTSIESQRQSGIPSAATNSNVPDIESSGESSTTSLLASIMKSGLISKNADSTFQHLNHQPFGPPQISDISSVKIPPLSTESAKAAQPQLPPGTLPLVSSATDTAEANSNPLSSLLSSLVAKGLISSTVEPQGQTGDQKSNQFSPTAHLSNSAPVQASSIPDSCSNPSSASELSLPEYSQAKETALLQDEAVSPKDLIGLEFKPEVLRSFHPVVVRSLFDDLKHQCIACGLRFQLKNKLRNHLAWHDSKTSKSNLSSRKWYPELKYSITGSFERHSKLIDIIDSVEQTTDMSLDKCDDETMVLADETQSICALCGEPFEDFYCHVRDEWMYKGTSYLSQPDDNGETVSLDGDDVAVGLIVHAKCIQRRAFENEETIDKSER